MVITGTWTVLHGPGTDFHPGQVILLTNPLHISGKLYQVKFYSRKTMYLYLPVKNMVSHGMFDCPRRKNRVEETLRK